MGKPIYLKAGRWTKAELQKLIRGVEYGISISSIARELRRSDTSTRKKAEELGLFLNERSLSVSQLEAKREADHLHALAGKCADVATAAGSVEFSNRLLVLGGQLRDKAWSIEAKANLPMTRMPGDRVR